MSADPVDTPDCLHESKTGDEGPVRDLSGGLSTVVRWRCDGCGAVSYDDVGLSALRAALDAAVAERAALRTDYDNRVARLVVKFSESAWLARNVELEAERDALQERIDKALALLEPRRELGTGYIVRDPCSALHDQARAVLVDDKGDNQQ